MKSAAVKEFVQNADNAKKANPLDLSSDQDLTIALMNLIRVEELSDGFSELGAMVSDIRNRLMAQIVERGDLRWGLSLELLGESARLMAQGMRALSDGKRKLAYEKFDACYGVYSVFWGINMGIIDSSDVEIRKTEN